MRTLVFVTTYLIARVGFAEMIPGGVCGTGTMAEFIALGETGCYASEAASERWSNVLYRGFLNGQPVDPAQQLVHFTRALGDPTDVTFYLPANVIPAGPVDFWAELAFTLLVDSPTLTLWRAFASIGAYQPGMTPYNFSDIQDVCVSGTFAPNCTGEEHQGITGFTPLEVAPGTTLISIRSRLTWQSSGPVGQVRVIAVGQLNDPFYVDIPEPSTYALSGLGLGALALMWRRSWR